MKKELTARRLREALDNKGMRAQDLANKTGIDKSSISQQLSGRHAPSDETAKKYAKVLDVDYLWLMGYDTASTDTTQPPSYIEKYLLEAKLLHDVEKYLSDLNDKGMDQVEAYIKFIASQEEYRK